MGSTKNSEPRLVIIEGKDKGKVIALHPGRIVIGRSKGEILVQDPRISRAHLAIHYEPKNGRVTFEDLKSLNGTTLNGVVTERGELRDGDKLQVGNTQIDCQIGSAVNLAADSDSVVADTNTDPTDDAPGKNPANLGPKTKIFLNQAKQAIRSNPRRSRNIGFVVVILVLLAGVMAREPRGIRSAAKSPETLELQDLFNAGSYDRVIEKATAMEKAGQTNIESTYLLADSYEKTGKLALAISTYQKLHDTSYPPDEIHIRLARLYSQAKFIKEAETEVSHIDGIIRTGKLTKQFATEAAELYFSVKSLNQPVEKVVVLAKALQNDLAKNDAIGYRLEAQVHFLNNDHKSALEALEAGRKVAPDDEWLIENIAFARLSLKDVKGSMEILEGWLDKHPHATKSLLVVSYLKFYEKQYDQAKAMLQKIVQRAAEDSSETHHPEALDLLGKIALAEGKHDEAAELTKRACESGFQEACSSQLLKAASQTANNEAAPPPPIPESDAPKPASLEPTAPPAAVAPPSPKKSDE